MNRRNFVTRFTGFIAGILVSLGIRSKGTAAEGRVYGKSILLDEYGVYIKPFYEKDENGHRYKIEPLARTRDSVDWLAAFYPSDDSLAPIYHRGSISGFDLTISKKRQSMIDEAVEESLAYVKKMAYDALWKGTYPTNREVVESNMQIILGGNGAPSS